MFGKQHHQWRSARTAAPRQRRRMESSTFNKGRSGTAAPHPKRRRSGTTSKKENDGDQQEEEKAPPPTRQRWESTTSRQENDKLREGSCYPQLKNLAVIDASVCNDSKTDMVKRSNEEANWNSIAGREDAILRDVHTFVRDTGATCISGARHRMRGLRA